METLARPFMRLCLNLRVRAPARLLSVRGHAFARGRAEGAGQRARLRRRERDQDGHPQETAHLPRAGEDGEIGLLKAVHTVKSG